MRRVVERLRAEGSEAVLELAEFEHALDEFLQNLERIAPVVQDLNAVAAKVVDLHDGEPLAWLAVRDQASRVNEWTDQFLVGFRELRRAVQGWNITDAADGPRSSER